MKEPPAKGRPNVFLARAKVNLYLHILGRRDDGYHDLDSLVVFADIGDELAFEPAPGFQFEITGPFKNSFASKELLADSGSQNMVVQAARKVAELHGRSLDFKISLTKNLPLAAGLGGGSADAACAVRALLTLWGEAFEDPHRRLLQELGADVPACFDGQASVLRGRGDPYMEVAGLPPIPAVLANTGDPCHTPEIFRRFAGPYKRPLELCKQVTDLPALYAFLAETGNDLQDPALEYVPAIGRVLEALRSQKGAEIVRMSGSGSTCFALFYSERDAFAAAQALEKTHSEWWIRPTLLNRR